MNREEPEPGHAASTRPHGLLSQENLLIEDEPGQERSLLFTLPIPLIMVVAVLALRPETLPWALGTGLTGALLAYTATRNAPIMLASAGLAPLLITPETGPLAVGLIALALLAWALGTGLVFLPAALGILLPAPMGAIALGTTTALIVAWTPEASPLHRLRIPPHTLDRLALVAGGLLALAGMVLAEPRWAAPLGLLAGMAARLLARHPANARIGASLTRTGALLAAAPAAFFFLLATLDRLPILTETRILLLAWSLLAIGAFILLAGLGAELLLRSEGPWASLFLGATISTILLAIGTTFLVQSDLGAMPLGAGWALAAPWIAVGAARLVKAIPGKTPFGWLGITVLIGTAYGIHVL